MEINWLWVALAAGLVYLGIFAFFLAKRQWTWAALGVALANFFWVLPNLVAPFRGALDPGYRGYAMGAIQLSPGIQVTIVTGAIIALAMIAAAVRAVESPRSEHGVHRRCGQHSAAHHVPSGLAGRPEWRRPLPESSLANTCRFPAFSRW